MRLLINFLLIITLFVGFSSCKKEAPQTKYNFIVGEWFYGPLYPIPGRHKNGEEILNKCTLEFNAKGVVTIITGDDYSVDSPIKSYKARYYITESTDTFFNYQINFDFKVYLDYNQKYGSNIRKDFSPFLKTTLNFKHHSKGDYIVDFGEGPKDNDEILIFNEISDRTFIRKL